MREEEAVFPNDATRAIRAIMEHLNSLQGSEINMRARAIILTHLEEAELMSFRLINN